jgi:GH18 family chitinase
MKKILIFTLTFVFLTGCSSANNDDVDEPIDAKASRIVIGYLPAWQTSYTPQWEKITHLYIAFGIVGADGSLDVSNIGKLATCISTAHQNKVKVLLSIGGGGSSTFSQALLNTEKRALLVANVDKAIKDFDLDGVDVDFEEWDGSPTGASATDLLKREAVEKMYKEIREKIGNEKLISAAVNASWNESKWGYYNCFTNTMHQYLDFVSLMQYDETGPWAGSNVGQHASWTFFEGSINYWLNTKKIPKQKLVAGVPFYGYLFKSATNTADAEAITYKNILNLYPNQDAHLNDNIGLLYYNGMETIKKKAKYIVDNDLGGIMIWELTQDTDDTDKSLLNVIYNEFTQH